METIIIQILRMLTQPKVWRILSFASSVVGMLCYALSSSFNHLFGRWSLLKIFLYSLLSFIICFSILFAKAWQMSSSLQLKIHLTFLVFTITTVYSFFFDKVNNKSDIYNLVSCAAFAVMSLSLSRQTYYGFELDLLNFFCAYLILQLMKIKLWLVVVGAGFSYSLTIIRSSLEVQQETGHFGSQVQEVIIQVHSHSQEPSGDSSENDVQMDSSPGQRAIFESTENLPLRSEEVDEEAPNEGEGKRHSVEVLLVNYDYAMIEDNLYQISTRLIAGGFEKEWSQVYVSFRKESLEESITALGLRKHSVEDVHNMPWQDLEDDVEKWIKASNAAFKVLFPRERRLCDRVFHGLSSPADLSFVEVCRESTVKLLKFADDLATGSGEERLFRIVDIFETLRDLAPELESLFSDQYSVWLKSEAIATWKRLGKAIWEIFIQMPDLICNRPVKMAVSGGGVHPISCYLMNYLRAACRSRQTLEQVFEDYEHPSFPSSLLVQMNLIMEGLESHLEASSKLYNKDPGLCYVFLMNNYMYIVQKIKDHELGALLGDDWIRKCIAKVRYYHEHYQRSSWNKVVGILKLESNGTLPPKLMKEKLKSFNGIFEETCRIQSSWFVFDEQLREEIRISLEKLLLPAYGIFLGRLQSVPKLSKHAEKYIKYEIEDIEARLNDLFQGSIV